MEGPVVGSCHRRGPRHFRAAMAPITRDPARGLNQSLFVPELSFSEVFMPELEVPHSPIAGDTQVVAPIEAGAASRERDQHILDSSVLGNLSKTATLLGSLFLAEGNRRNENLPDRAQRDGPVWYLSVEDAPSPAADGQASRGRARSVENAPRHTLQEAQDQGGHREGSNEIESPSSRQRDKGSAEPQQRAELRSATRLLDAKDNRTWPQASVFHLNPATLQPHLLRRSRWHARTQHRVPQQHPGRASLPIRSGCR